ncbi:Asp-tRNA(Asn)/Glu-tRNA(Gln) amidotransferase subunit GatA, partial [Paenibacillus sp. 28ISP30-2]|nr:Asp-tRNA(Asn)/Glu-tRNA(Gln) amidotransferase subunit GatA [Paenibacillus sp. 28ISP30-2]
MSLFDNTLPEIHNKLHQKEISVSDLVGHALETIGAREDKIRAYITVDEEQARASARQLDDHLISGEERGLLFGLPVGIKDNIVTEGLRTTCGSQFLKNFDPVYDATVVGKLRAAQTVTLGKMNMDEDAMGGPNDTGRASGRE